ncbi:MAG: SAM-dependent methyltransferase [Parabacteroides sp.]|nr:SAM-dependent methyltransferase [Parabacteroides sp.]
MKNKIPLITEFVTKQLENIDYNKLPISDYNKRYIRNLKSALPYYMLIYETCIQKGLQAIHVPLTEIIFVDYGGGSGFLSILAKQIGFGQVIYIDLNPNSVETIRILKEEIGIGPDIILHGDSDKLKTWCKEHNCKPQLLIATDLIEHVYQLESFFADLIAINSQIQMLFTTASTPFNPYVKRRLHRIMKEEETGFSSNPNYYTLRLQYIQQNFTYFSKQEAEEIALKTRGLIFSDIHKAITQNQYPSLNDPFNTCDPRNGNWTERILPIETYCSIVRPHGFFVQIEKGFYNTQRKNKFFSFIVKCLNRFIKISGKRGFIFAPFIILTFRKK